MRQSTSKALNKEIFGVQNASFFFFCFALKIIFFRITIQVIVEQKNQHKFHNVLVFGLFILNYISLCKTWWLRLPAWFENDPKSIYVLVYMQEHPKTFNSRFKINESQIFNVYPFFSPGVYVHDTSQSKVSWPMKFSSPDWSKVPSLERRALRTEVQICLWHSSTNYNSKKQLFFFIIWCVLCPCSSTTTKSLGNRGTGWHI